MPAKIINIRGIIGRDVLPENIESALSSAKGASVEGHISSPGGLIVPGIEIFNMFRRYKGEVKMHITSLAASMASYIALAGKQKPTVEKNSIYFIHNAQGMAAGDQNVMRKMADTLENLSNIFAREYAKVSGQGIKSVKSMMDAETEFIGHDIVKSGFASQVLDDDLIDSVDDEAVALARLEIEECEKFIKSYKMQETEIDQICALLDFEPEMPYPNEHSARMIDPEKFQQDSFRRKNIESGIDIIIGKLKNESTMITQAYRFKKNKWTVAEAKKWLKDHDVKYISFEPASGSEDNTAQIPAIESRETITEEDSMNLKEFLAQNPAASIEYEVALKQERQAGRQEMMDIAAKAAPIIQSDKYPESIKNVALEVCQGKKSADTLDMMVATADMIEELKKSKEAEGEQKGETKGEQDQPGMEFTEMVKKDRQMMGLEV